MTVAAALLRGIHRQVGVAHQLVALAGAAFVHGDPDARTERDIAPGEPRRPRQPVEQTICKADRELLVGPLEEQGELVAAEPGQRVALADRHAEAPCDLLEQPVTAVVPERVVHLLEPVEVDEQDREVLSGARRARELLIEAVPEERAVCEPGQAVVKRLMGELFFQPDPLGHIARVQDDAADVPVGAEVADMGLELPPLAEFVL